MAETIITVRVIRRNARADAIVRDVGATLGQDDLEPDEGGFVRIRMRGAAPRQWELVRDALDRAGSDWRQWLHLEPRPNR